MRERRACRRGTKGYNGGRCERPVWDFDYCSAGDGARAACGLLLWRERRTAALTRAAEQLEQHRPQRPFR